MILSTYRTSYRNILIEAVIGNIADETADAIVNAANSRLAGGGGVDGAIHRRGGPAIMEETNQLYPGGCPTGYAVVSTAGNLNSQYVVHTVAPVFVSGNENQQALLASAYRQSLQQACQAGCRTVAFPSLGTGAYHWPVALGSEIAIKTLMAFIDQLPDGASLERVRFVLFDMPAFQAYRDKIGELVPPPWLPQEDKMTGAVDYRTVEEVQRYDERMGTIRNVARENEYLLSKLNPTPESTILEIGFGTGIFARTAAGRCKKVVAFDVSEAMRLYAQQKARAEGIANVEFRKGGFLNFDVGEEQFDFAFSSLALHHLNDQWKAEAVHRIGQAVRPGGLFLLVDVIWDTPGDGFCDYVTQFIPPDLDPVMLLPLFGHIKKESSTFCWIMEGIFDRCGFDILTKEHFGSLPMLYLCKKRA